MPAAGEKAASLAPIQHDTVYPLEVFKRLSGLSAWALRTAKRNGLMIREAGNRKYVVGRDWMEYLSRQDG